MGLLRVSDLVLLSCCWSLATAVYREGASEAAARRAAKRGAAAVHAAADSHQSFSVIDFDSITALEHRSKRKVASKKPLDPPLLRGNLDPMALLRSAPQSLSGSQLRALLFVFALVAYVCSRLLAPRPRPPGADKAESCPLLAEPAGRRLPAWVTKADALFMLCDRNRDGLLDFEELCWLMRIRHPEDAPCTQEWFRQFCVRLGADPRRGVAKEAFRMSYVVHGGDVDYDFAMIERANQKRPQGRRGG